MTRLDEIAREHYYEPARHAGHHLLMSRATFDALPRNEPAPGWGLPLTLAQLTDIRVVVDDALPPGVWQLVETGSGDVIEQGEVTE